MLQYTALDHAYLAYLTMPTYLYINTSRVFVEIVQCCGCITLTRQQCVGVHVVDGEMSFELCVQKSELCVQNSELCVLYRTQLCIACQVTFCCQYNAPMNLYQNHRNYEPLQYNCCLVVIHVRGQSQLVQTFISRQSWLFFMLQTSILLQIPSTTAQLDALHMKGIRCDA